MSLFTDLVVTISLWYYLRILNSSRGLGQTKMLSTIVNFADHNGVLTWFLGFFLRKRSFLTRIVNSLVTLASLVCVRMSFVLFAICVDVSCRTIVGRHALQLGLPWSSLYNWEV